MEVTSLPVLLIVFNRPNTTKEVFDVLRLAKPPRLYIAADGPRSESERVKCDQVRDIVTKVDWECDVKTLFQENNLGCGRGVVTGIDWFFENEEYGVILEDDCLPAPSFFSFCEVLLSMHKNDERIMHINGNNYGADALLSNGRDYSYQYGSIPQVWGWASWRRAWQKYDMQLSNLDELLESDYFKELYKEPVHRSRQENRWKQVAAGKIDTWDFQWQYSVIANHGLTIVPNVNLISNIGFGVDATHTKKSREYQSMLRTESLTLPLIHPKMVIPDVRMNHWFQKNMLGEHRIHKRIFSRIRSMMRG